MPDRARKSISAPAEGRPVVRSDTLSAKTPEQTGISTLAGMFGVTPYSIRITRSRSLPAGDEPLVVTIHFCLLDGYLGVNERITKESFANMSFVLRTRNLNLRMGAHSIRGFRRE